MDIIHAVQSVLMFVWNHYDLFLTLLGSILAIVRVTAWGAANARALQVVTGVVESLSAKDAPPNAPNDAQAVKQIVAAKERRLDPAVADALRDAVAVVDPAKTPATPMQRFVRELLRTPGKPTV
jgi:hypothetical protein